jgi:hypothetical protein
MLALFRRLLHSHQDLSVQVFDDLALVFAGTAIVVEARRGINFKHPIARRWVLNASIYNYVHTAQTQSHVARQPNRDRFEFRMNNIRYVDGISTGREVGIVEKPNYRTFRHHTFKRESLSTQFVSNP